MSYQAVIRNGSGELVINQMVGMQISILQGSVTGTLVYSETQTPTTNENGLISIEIGGGAGFEAINWAVGSYFLKTETDPTGGASYTITGTTQLLSVPYALHAKTAEMALRSTTETDPLFSASPANGITTTNLNNWSSAFGWGSHSSAGYLKSFSETDPKFNAHVASGITPALIDSWNEAFGWGNHSSQGYLKSFTETDPTFTSNFDFTDAETNDLLQFNGTKWVKHTPNFSLANHTHIDATITTSGFISSSDKIKLDGLQNADGSETLVIAGTNVTITGSGTLANPYIISTTSFLPPTATTQAATNIESFSATLNGTVNANNFSSTVVFEWGLTTAYGTTTNATQSPLTRALDVAVSINLTGLQSATLYHYRIKASNAVNITYSDDITFTTGLSGPQLTTTPVTAILAFSATTGGDITFDGGSTVTARGVCYGTSPSPTTANSITANGTGSGLFVSDLTELTHATTYFVRAYATNGIGTSYGNEVSFRTSTVIPTVTTINITEISQRNASSGGNITSDGGANVTERGVLYSSNRTVPIIMDPRTSDGIGTGTFASSLVGLLSDLTYYVRAYAINNVGIGYGEVESFKTLQAILPTINTLEVTEITPTTAISGGNLISDGGTSIYSCGVCWSTSVGPTTSDNKTTDSYSIGPYSSHISGLAANSTYYIRAYATNSVGTSYGEQKSFSTLEGFGTLTDPRDSRVYKWVAIGTQKWMSENLAFLPSVSPSTDGSETTAFYYAYGYEGSIVSSAKATVNYTTYGILYNWPASLTACPAGWHLPSDVEWTTLTNYLGGEEIAGGKLKETGTNYWTSPNTGANNETGFSALPGGNHRDNNGSANLYTDASFWTSTENIPEQGPHWAWGRQLYYATDNVYRYNGYNRRSYGYSVRCIKD